MISKHIFTSDVISGKQLWINGLNSTGDLIVASTDFDIENNLKVGEDLSIGGDSILSGNANISGNLFVDQTFTAKGAGNFNSNLTVGGDLTVNGTTTTVNSTTLTVDDKNIELGSLDTPTDTTADGGGITLKGTTDKEFKWTNTSNAWNSSEHLGIADGKYLFTDKVRARDGAGLFLEDDGGNGIFVQDGGNVGIGTTIPSQKLEVAGSVKATFISLNTDGEYSASISNTNHSPKIKFKGINSGVGLNYSLGIEAIDGNNNKFHINRIDDANGLKQNLLTIKSDGNVGIGTTSPGQMLSIKGDKSGFSISSEDYENIVYMGRRASTEPDLGYFRLRNASTTTVAIDSAGDSYFNGGNVGIGTSTPDRLLEIHGTQHAGNLTALKLTNDMANDNGEGVSIEFGGFSDSIMGSIESRMRSTSSNSDLIFSTNPGTNNTDLSERMRIAANGNVGIGTASPDQILDIRPAQAGKYGLHLIKPGASDSLGGLFVESDNTTSLYLKDRTQTPISSVRLKANGDSYFNGGNVGIGATSPESRLHIAQPGTTIGGNDLTKGCILLGSSTEGVAIDNNEIIKKGPANDSDFVIGNANSAGRILLRTNAANRVVISNGSTDISGNLSVSGNLTVNGTTTTVNSTTVTVDDKNLELGSVATPTDTTANGGGITLKGATDKTIIWSQANNSWNLNQNLSIIAGKHIETEKLKALNNNGLKLEDDAGNGIHIIDGGNVEFSNDITVSGSSTFNGDIFANEDVNIVKNLNVEGSSIFENNVTFDKNINVSGDFTFNGSNPLEVKNGILDIDPAAGAPAPTTNKLYNLAGDLYWNGINVTSKLSDEQVQDIIGGMVSSNTEGGITVTYADNGSSAGKLNFSVDSQTDNNFTDTLKNKLDGIDAGATALPTFSATQNGKVLKVSGGNLSWEDDDVNIAVVPGGANTQVQFNNNGSFGGSANLTFDGTNLSCAGDVVSYASSDKKLKNNISNISSPIEKIKQINGVNFEWSEKQSVYTGKDVGVLAQDVEKVLPEVVSEREDGYLAVKYEKIIPLLIEAIKDQQKEIEELKKKLS